jgi:hypothetical protein
VIRVQIGNNQPQTYTIRQASSSTLTEEFKVRFGLTSSRSCTYLIQGLTQVTSDIDFLYFVLAEIMPDAEVVYIRQNAEDVIYIYDEDITTVFIKPY